MAVKFDGGDPNTVVRWFEQRWVDLKNDRAERELVWQDCAYAYACKFNKGWVEVAKAAGRSARYFPAIYDSIETIVPLVRDVVFGTHDWMTMKPARRGGGTESDDNYAEAMQWFLASQLEQCKYRSSGEDVIRQMAIFGNAPYQTTWRTDYAVNYPAYAEAVSEYMSQNNARVEEFRGLFEEWQAQKQAAVMAGIPEPQQPVMPDPPMPPVDREIAYNGPQILVGDIFNYVEEMFPDSEQTTLRAYRSWQSSAFMKRMSRPNENGYRLYENLGSIGGEQHIRNEKDANFDQVKATILNMNMPDRQKGNELITFTGTFEIGSKTYENHIAVMGNRSGIIRLEPLPLWSGESHIRNARLIKLIGDPYGVGVAEKALGLEDIIQAQSNQIIDVVAAAINPEYEVVADGLLDVMKPSGPGARHMVNQQGTINPIQKNIQGLPVGMSNLQSTMQRLEQTTGAAYASGGGDPRESATKTAGRGSIANARMTYIARRIEDEFVEPSLDQMIQMDAQYIEEDQFFVVTQSKKVKWSSVSPMAIRRGWLIKAAGSKLFIDEHNKQERNLMVFQTITNNPALSVITDMPYFYRNFLRDLGYENADRISLDTEESRLMMVQMFMSMGGILNDGAGNSEDEQNGGQGPEMAQAAQGLIGGGADPGDSGDDQLQAGIDGPTLEALLSGVAAGPGLR